MRRAVLAPQQIGGVERALIEHLDLLPRPAWQRQIPAAVEAACEGLGIEQSALLEQMEHDPAVAEAVAAYLMVGETYFFRHQEHFESALEFLRNTAASSGSRRLRVWCAGCASGEEPYSLLLLVHARLPQYEDRVEILGTDLDPGAIQAAEAAVYSPWSFRRPAPDWAGRFFSPSVVQGRITLPQVLRRRVRFRCEPIARTIAKSPSSSFDLVFFRNVGIYLGDSAREQLFTEFSRVLRPTGRLVVAPGDPRPSRMHFQRDDDASTCWYHPTRNSPGSPSGQTVPKPDPPEHPKRPPQPVPAVPPPQPTKLRLVKPPKDAENPPERPSTAQVAAEPAAGGRSKLREARQLADRGQLGQAIELLDDEAATGLQVLRLRGSLLLAAERFDEALADFRAVLYRRPTDQLCRYWMSLVLMNLGMGGRAVTHLRGLRRTLSELAPRTRLEDDDTTAGELLRAVDERLGELA